MTQIYLISFCFGWSHWGLLFFLQDLKDFLKSSLEGKAILHCYKDSEILDDDERNLLVDLVGKWIVLRNINPKSDDFIAMKNKILELFPNEPVS